MKQNFLYCEHVGCTEKTRGSQNTTKQRKKKKHLELICDLVSQMIQDKHTEISFIFILVNIWTVTLNTHYHLQ